MNIKADTDLYSQTLPVFRQYAPRIVNLAELSGGQIHSLSARLVPDTFAAGEHFLVAQGFVIRTIYPVLGRKCPEFTTEEPSFAGIAQRHTELMLMLDGLSPSDFAGAAARQISHVAGEATITQSGREYVQLFGMPNFFFHMTMGYASLRASGVAVGKAHFDGLHSYAPGFSFTDP